MSEKLIKRKVSAVYLKRLSDQLGVVGLANLMNITDSHIYSQLKEGETSVMLELASKQAWEERHPESSADKKHIWMVKVPDDQTDVLGKILTALGCKFSRFIS